MHLLKDEKMIRYLIVSITRLQRIPVLPISAESAQFFKLLHVNSKYVFHFDRMLLFAVQFILQNKQSSTDKLMTSDPADKACFNVPDKWKTLFVMNI